MTRKKPLFSTLISPSQAKVVVVGLHIILTKVVAECRISHKIGESQLERKTTQLLDYH
jgi:hypothetical protein